MCRIESKDVYVYPENSFEIIRCSLKGKFKKEFGLKKDKLYKTDIAVVGDFVEYDLNNDGSGVIYSINKRENYLSRKAPKIKGSGFKGERLEQIIASNIDVFFIISSVFEPQFNNKVIDRFLVAAESSNVNSEIIINKSDLDLNNSIESWINLYKKIGYSIFKTSIINNEGIDRLRKNLEGKKNLFWGQSGVGKSSLLNLLFPNLNLEIGKISSFTDKGKHTTVTTTLIKISEKTFVIDTPGIREIAPYGIAEEDLSHYFIEFGDFLTDCRFNTCTHNHEPGCAVIEAVKNGKISDERYESYLRILDTIEDDTTF